MDTQFLQCDFYHITRNTKETRIEFVIWYQWSQIQTIS